MKHTLPVLAALMLASVSSPAFAQSQNDQMACEGDVYELCGEAIPDQDRIVACLRKQWSKVSKECRQVMISYKKKGGPKGESGDGTARGNAADY